jgi:tellurite resistance protein
MRLKSRINAAGLSASVARTFTEALTQVASAKGGLEGNETALINKLLGKHWSAEVEPAPFEALWPHGELFLTCCIYVAVADGHYDVEEARIVSGYAHRLGLSAAQLSELEARVFKELQERGAARAGDGES